MALPEAARPLPHLLVIEDDPNISRGLREFLLANGFQVSIAADGEAAIRQLRESPHFDLVILDLGLPKKDGFEVLRVARQSEHRIPVLVVTGRGDRQNKIKGFDLGADDYLVKPFDPTELLARVRALLRRAAADSPTTDTPRESKTIDDQLASVLDRMQTQLREHILAEGHLREAKRAADREQRRTAEILKRIGHDIRTPLSTIMGYSDVLIEETKGHHREFADIIKDCSKRVQEILDAILDLYLLDEEDVMQFEIVDLKREAKQVLDVTHDEAARKNLQLELSAPEDQTVAAKVDRTAYSHVLRHLLRSAIRNAERGVIQIRIDVREGQALVLVSPDSETEVTELPSRPDESLYQDEHANLMLLISQQLVEYMGGYMHVERRDEVEQVYLMVFSAVEPDLPHLPDRQHYG